MRTVHGVLLKALVPISVNCKHAKDQEDLMAESLLTYKVKMSIIILKKALICLWVCTQNFNGDTKQMMWHS